MKYTKAKFLIRTGESLREVSGYTFEAMFSTADVHKLGVHHEKGTALKHSHWVVTDLKTGLLVNEGATRKEAVERFMSVNLSKLERLVYSNVHYSASPACHENGYEHLCSVFEEMARDYERGIA